jgi:hypothetical protein
MENYKKTFYSKKFSNDFNFALVQGKKAPWKMYLRLESSSHMICVPLNFRFNYLYSAIVYL